MRIPALLLAAALLLPSASAPAAVPPLLEPLAAETAARLEALSGDGSPAAAAARAALLKAEALLAKGAKSPAREAKLAAAVAKVLGPAFPGDEVLSGLFADARLGMAAAWQEGEDELAALAGALPPESKEGLAAAAALASLLEARAGMDGTEDLAAFAAAARDAERALAKGRRVVRGNGTWVAATRDGDEAFASRVVAASLLPAEGGGFDFELTCYDPKPKGKHNKVVFGVAGIAGPGPVELKGLQYAIFGVFTHRSVGVNYNTLSGPGAGGTLTVTRFEPGAGILDGTFSMVCSGGGISFPVTGALRVRIAP